MANEHPTKLCECGCGQPTNVATRNKSKRGHIKGQPFRFIKGHSMQTQCIKHGMTSTPIYRTWQHMLARCTNPFNDSYRHYGGRGITVCTRWLTFENFLEDMGQRPPGKTLDRYPNNDGNYEPKNCRWATGTEQQNNRRGNILLSALGRTQTLMQWSRETGICFPTLAARIRRGMTHEDAVTKPVHRRPKRTSKIVSVTDTRIGSDTAAR